MGARGVIMTGAAVAAIAAAVGAYLFLTGKNPIAAREKAAAAADAAAFSGEDAEDALAIEADALPQVEGDPWLDPGDDAIVEGEGSGDFVEGEEPFEDVYDPETGAFDRGAAPPSDPIDPAEIDPPGDAEPPAEEPAPKPQP